MCDRCSLPGAHLLAGDCVRALKKRLADKDALVERLRLSVKSEQQAARANLQELMRMRKMHDRATAAYDELTQTIGAIRRMATR